MTIFPGEPVPQLRCRCAHRAFSLIELVVALTIVATVSAIAIPRVKSSSVRAQVAAVRSDLELLNKALEFYRIEHGRYPDSDDINEQLTMYTDKSGTRFSSTATADGIDLGPYILRIPAVPMGPNAGASAISDVPAANVGWLYSESLWVIVPNFRDEADEIPADIVDLVGNVDAGATVDLGGAVGP